MATQSPPLPPVEPLVSELPREYPALSQQRRLALEADVSLLLDGAASLDMGLQHLARLAVADFVDWCTVDLCEAEGPTLRRVAVACAHPEQQVLARALEEHPPSRGQSTGPGRVAQRGLPEWVERQPARVLDTLAEDLEHRSLLARLHLVSSLCVPLVGREGRFGALWLGTVEGGRVLTQEDLGFAERLGRRAGLAVEAAQRQASAVAMLHERERALHREQALFELSPVGLAVFDRHLSLVRMNAALQALTGVAPQQALHRPLAEGLPSLAPALEAAARRVLEGGSAVRDVPVEGPPDASGAPRRWSASLLPLPGLASTGNGTGNGAPEELLLAGVALPVAPLRPPAQLHALPSARHRRDGPGKEGAGREGGAVWRTPLRTSEERFRALVLATSQLLWTTDPVGLVVEDSPSWRAYTGQSWEEFRGMGWLHVVHPDDVALCDSAWRAAVAAGSRYDLEYRLRGRDGAYRLFSVHAVPLRGPDGAVREWVGASTDITERAEAARRTELLGGLSAALSGVLTVAQVAEVVMERTLRGLGAIAGALVQVDGEKLSTVHSVGFPPGLFSAGMSLSLVESRPIEQAVQSGELVLVRSRESFRTRYPHLFAAAADAGHRALAVVPLHGAKGRRGALTLSFRAPQDFEPAERLFLRAMGDVTAQALDRARLYDAEHAARAESEAAQGRLAFLAEASEALSTDLDDRTTFERLAQLAVMRLADACIIDVLDGGGQPRRTELAARRPEMAAALEGLRAFPPARDGDTPVARVLRSGQPELVAHVDAPFLDALPVSAEQREQLHQLGPTALLVVPMLAHGKVLGALSLVLLGAERHFEPRDLALAEELSRRAALALENARLYRAAQEAVRARDEFLAVASHELKTPLTPLALRLAQLERLATRGDGQAQLPVATLHHDLDAARRQVRRLRDLIEELLDASHFSLGAQHFALEPVDLAEVVKAVASRWASQATRAGCELRVEAEVGRAVGQWNRARLEQVTTSLLTNALRYGAGHPVCLRVRSAEGWAQLSVQDAGIGISPADQERIFGRFERAVSERHYGGLGLGLYLTRQTVTALGGQVRVRSAPGRGATFTVDLPLTPAAAQG